MHLHVFCKNTVQTGIYLRYSIVYIENNKEYLRNALRTTIISSLDFKYKTLIMLLFLCVGHVETVLCDKTPENKKSERAKKIAQLLIGAAVSGVGLYATYSYFLGSRDAKSDEDMYHRGSETTDEDMYHHGSETTDSGFGSFIPIVLESTIPRSLRLHLIPQPKGCAHGDFCPRITIAQRFVEDSIYVRTMQQFACYYAPPNELRSLIEQGIKDGKKFILGKDSGIMYNLTTQTWHCTKGFMELGKFLWKGYDIRRVIYAGRMRKIIADYALDCFTVADKYVYPNTQLQGDDCPQDPFWVFAKKVKIGAWDTKEFTDRDCKQLLLLVQMTGYKDMSIFNVYLDADTQKITIIDTDYASFPGEGKSYHFENNLDNQFSCVDYLESKIVRNWNGYKLAKSQAIAEAQDKIKKGKWRAILRGNDLIPYNHSLDPEDCQCRPLLEYKKAQ